MRAQQQAAHLLSRAQIAGGELCEALAEDLEARLGSRCAAIIKPIFVARTRSSARAAASQLNSTAQHTLNEASGSLSPAFTMARLTALCVWVGGAVLWCLEWLRDLLTQDLLQALTQ